MDKLHPRSVRVLLGILIGAEALLTLYLICDHRWPRGHDAFQYFTLQYYFLNNKVSHGEIPQWLPYMTQGMVGNWWYFLQAGILQNALFLVAPSLQGFNFLPLFHLGMFFDQLLLLLGTWLLGRRVFASPYAALFVCICVLGSCIWFDQPWCNLHFYYAIPLVLHLLHSWIEEGRHRDLFLAGNLLGLQCLGSPPYLAPVVLLAVALYVTPILLREHKSVVLHFKSFFQNPVPGGMVVLGVGLTVLGLAFLLFQHRELVRVYAPGRGMDGSITIQDYLNYGTDPPLRWVEMLTGVSNAHDYTLFFGHFALALAVIGLLFARWSVKGPFLFPALTLALFSNSTLVSQVFYYLWPGMSFYRHLALASPLVKLFLCFLAGVGLETLLLHRLNRPTLLFLSGTFLALAVVLLPSEGRMDALRALHTAMRTGLPSHLRILETSPLAGRLWLSVVSCLAVAAFLTTRKVPLSPTLRVLLPLLALAELYTYKWGQLQERTYPVAATQQDLTQFQAIPFRMRRNLPLENNPRFIFTPNISKRGKGEFSDYRVGYSSNESFLFHDAPGSAFRVDLLLAPFDDLLKAYWKQLPHEKPQGLVDHGYLNFPSSAPTHRIAGITENKLQVFQSVKQTSGQILPEEATRLNLPISIQGFSSNHLELELYNPTPRPIWLLYSDVWHPNWRATVNSQEAKVERAYLAYKGVQLPSGKNRVLFRFYSPALAACFLIFSLSGMFWTVYVLVQGYQELRRARMAHAPGWAKSRAIA